MMGFQNVGKLMALYRVVLIILTFHLFTKRMVERKIDFIDLLILLLIVFIIISSLFSKVDFQNLYIGISTQLLMMLFFFVGRSKYASDYSFFNRAIVVVVFVSICGLVLYFYNPGWYLEMKMEKSGVSHSYSVQFAYEMMRLSAFWPYPYWISYGSAIVYSYIIIIGYQFGKLSIKMMALLLFLLGILLLAQQRLPLFITMFVSLFFIIGGLNKKKSLPYFKLNICLYLLVVAAAFITLVSVIDIDMLERLYSKIEEASGGAEFLADRSSIFSDVSSKSLSLFGDGLGYYSLNRADVGVTISDHQYLKILYENGVLGFLGYITIFVLCILKGIRNYRDNLFELTIVAMYLLAMSGANCLCVEEQHPAVFWFCCGRLFNNNCLKYKKEDTFPLGLLS